MHRLGQIFFFCLFIGQISAQSKFNPALYQQLEKLPKDSSLSIMIKGDLTVLEEMVFQLGGHWKYQVADIASVELSPKGILALASSPALQRAEIGYGPWHKLHHEDSSLVKNNRFLAVQQGQSPFPQAFLGKNSILGVIDDGFEWRHPDFKDSLGNTRILSLWDQGMHLNRFQNLRYNYGTVWDRQEIQQNICLQSAGAHGSHVAGIAAGNGLAANKFKGVAPEANLIFVKTAENQAFHTCFVDAAHYIFQQADSLGMPCAINSSLGSYFGSHDGEDLHAQAIRQMLLEKNGRTLVQAAGNARQDNFHLRAAMQTQDTARWTFDYYNAQNASFFVFFADTAHWDSVNFQVKFLNKNNPQNILGQSPKYSFDTDFILDTLSQLRFLKDTLFWESSLRPVVLEVWQSTWGSSHEYWVWVQQNPTQNYWQFEFWGQDILADCWAKSSYTGTSNLVASLCSPLPDNSQTLVSSWTCLPEVITVGSYQNQGEMLNYRQQLIDLSSPGYPVGGISHFSSLGPTRDGRLKPNITTSGGQVLSASTISLLNQYRQNSYTYLDSAGWHVSNRGTSMAAPIAAGAAALYLECNPNASAIQILDAMQNTTYQDSFVYNHGSLPNVNWGYGKLDIDALMQSCLVYGCTDSLANNYDPLAVFDDGSCWNISTKNDKIENKFLKLFPNPNQGTINFDLEESGQWQLFDAYGRLVFELSLVAGRQQFQLPPLLSKGYYFWYFRAKGQRETGGLIVE